MDIAICRRIDGEVLFGQHVFESREVFEVVLLRTFKIKRSKFASYREFSNSCNFTRVQNA